MWTICAKHGSPEMCNYSMCKRVGRYPPNSGSRYPRSDRGRGVPTRTQMVRRTHRRRRMCGHSLLTGVFMPSAICSRNRPRIFPRRLPARDRRLLAADWSGTGLQRVSAAGRSHVRTLDQTDTPSTNVSAETPWIRITFRWRDRPITTRTGDGSHGSSARAGTSGPVALAFCGSASR